jgi:hypothetical protein
MKPETSASSLFFTFFFAGSGLFTVFLTAFQRCVNVSFGAG